jgi:hypothetical protein
LDRYVLARKDDEIDLVETFLEDTDPTEQVWVGTLFDREKENGWKIIKSFDGEELEDLWTPYINVIFQDLKYRQATLWPNSRLLLSPSCIPHRLRRLP